MSSTQEGIYIVAAHQYSLYIFSFYFYFLLIFYAFGRPTLPNKHLHVNLKEAVLLSAPDPESLPPNTCSYTSLPLYNMSMSK